MSSVLVVNAGSSSLKLALLDPADEVTAALAIDHWDGESDHDELRDFLTTQRQIAAVGHRVVHGGAELTRATVIDEPVLTQIKALTDLAPLHQPRALAAIAAARALLPQVPQVACFDTAFHATLPPAAGPTPCRPHGPSATACAGTASTGCPMPTPPAAALSSWK